MIKVTADREVSRQTIESLLVSALEGGSNYWYQNITPLKLTSTKATFSERFYEDLLTHGFSIEDKTEDEPVVHTVHPKAFETSLTLMSAKYPHHFNDVTCDNADASTGDVFLQLAVFGDVIYG